MSLRGSEAGLRKARQALARRGWTQQELADRIPCTRQPIGYFFQHKRISRTIFQEICHLLDLDWEDIAEFDLTSPETQSTTNSKTLGQTDIETIIQEIREQIRPIIKQRCGTIRVLDMTQPIDLDEIYTNVNILEKITGNRIVGIKDLQKDFDPVNLGRLLIGRITTERLRGIDAVNRYPKLMLYYINGMQKKELSEI